MSAAEQILTHALGRQPTLGSSRLIALDGPSGSGKSTVAREIGELTEASVVHTDDLCPGWDGIPLLPQILEALLRPLASTETGRAPRYDWILGHTVDDVILEPRPVVVLEGVGAGALSIAAVTTTLAWIDGDAITRQERAFARDGDHFRQFWESWAEAERTFYAAQDLPGRADLRFRT